MESQSRFIEMFGNPLTNEKEWKTSKISEVAPSIAYKGTIEQTHGKFWLLNLDMIESNTGKLIDKIMVHKKDIGSSTYAFSPENVLYSKLRPYLNKVIVPDDYGYATTELVPLLPKKTKLNSVFLENLLRGDVFVQYINNKTAGAKMPRVSMSVFWNIDIIIPPIELQNQFADFVSQVDKSKFVIQYGTNVLATILRIIIYNLIESE